MHLGRRIFMAVFLAAIALGSSVATPPVQAAASGAEAAHKNKIIARWYLTEKDQLRTAYQRGIDVLEDHPDLRKGYFTILTNDEELAALRADGYSIEVINYDWYSSYAAGAQAVNGGFRNYAQCIALMDSIHTNHPTITNDKIFLGITNDGNFLWGMKISDNPDVDEDEPEVLFTGMHHAREPIGMEICLETMKRLTDGYGTDTMLTRLVNEREIFFVPIVNPDGYEYNRITDPNGGGMWRKNRSENIDGSRGVDINRNYGQEWGYDDEGSSPIPSDETYRGEFAFSEVETQAMRDFINAHHFVFAMNYHSYGNLYLWPWGYDYVYTPDETLFRAIGDSVTSFNGYTPEVGWTLYPTNGDSDDWGYGATGEHAKIFSFTPEVGEWFWPDPSQIPEQVEENQAPNFLIIDLAETPERIFPPVNPTWTTADTVYSGNYDLTWTDPGGLNAAASFDVQEFFGPHEVTDDAESGSSDWSLSGFTQSTARAFSGTKSYYGGHTDATHSRMTAAAFRKVQPGDAIQLKIWYAIEKDWDYAYVEISTDGGQTFATLPGNITTNTNPHGNNRGNGITGFSSGFVTGTFDLSAYAGQQALLRLSYETDAASLEEGVYFDDISPLLRYDSVNALGTTSAPLYSVVGGTGGTHRYRVTSIDGDGQRSTLTPPNEVVVFVPVPGDLDNNQTIDVVDLSQLIDYVFGGGVGAALSGAEECNGFAPVNVLDIVCLIDYIFRGGPAPVGLP